MRAGTPAARQPWGATFRRHFDENATWRHATLPYPFFNISHFPSSLRHISGKHVCLSHDQPSPWRQVSHRTATAKAELTGTLCDLTGRLQAHDARERQHRVAREGAAPSLLHLRLPRNPSRTSNRDHEILLSTCTKPAHRTHEAASGNPQEVARPSFQSTHARLRRSRHRRSARKGLLKRAVVGRQP